MFEPPVTPPFGCTSFRPIPWFAWGPREAELRVDDRIRKTVVFVGTGQGGGPFVPFGTAFATVSLYEREAGWQSLISAKHVIEDIPGDDVMVRLNTRLGEAVVVPTEKKMWFPHPDPSVDVAICPTVFMMDQFDITHFPIDGPDTGQNCALTDELVKDYAIGIGDDVYVPGMFVNRIGQRQNLPILRIGTIAAMPEEPIETTYGLHDAFLVEVRSIDGLSGSPVCINLIDRSLPSSVTPRRSLAIGPRPAYFLAGMVLGYNEVFNPHDTIEIQERSSETVTRAIVPLNTGIAIVLPIWRILEAMEQLREPRERARREQNQDKGRGFVPTSAAPLGVPETKAGSDENPDHREDFNRLVSAASKSKLKGGRT